MNTWVGVLAAFLKRDTNGSSLLHGAARDGCLNRMPKWLVRKSLLDTDSAGLTALHTAALFGHLDQVPVELLTLDNLLLGDKDGDTVLHYAALHTKS